MDFLVNLFRALANELRLRMLRTVNASPGITVTGLVEALAVPKDVVSANLRVLTRLGLLDARPSGRHVHVHPATRKVCRSQLSLSALRQLARLWQEAEVDPGPIVGQLWDSAASGSPPAAAQVSDICGRLCFFFTAYTHLRRLLILRALATDASTTLDQLRERIGMSSSAASRQLLKLQRRGLVEPTHDKGQAQWRLVASPNPPFQRALHRAVMKDIARGA